MSTNHIPRVVIADYDFGDVDIRRSIVTEAGFELRAAQAKSEDDVIANEVGSRARLERGSSSFAGKQSRDAHRHRRLNGGVNPWCGQSTPGRFEGRSMQALAVFPSKKSLQLVDIPPPTLQDATGV